MVLRSFTREQRIALALLGLVAGVVYAGLALTSTPMPQLAIIGPIAYFVAILGDAGTALVLIATWRSSPARRSTLVLALSFGLSALVLFIAILILPLLPLEPAILRSTPQAGIWIFIAFHVNAAIGALAYVWLRTDDSSAMPSWRFIRRALLAVAAVLVAELAIAFGLSPYLPSLVTGASLAGLQTTGVGPFAVGILFIAAFCALRLKRPNAIDRALACSLVALGAGMALFVVGGHRYTASFYSGRVLLLLGAIFVLGSAVQTLIASRSRLADIEGALTREVGETARQAKRIRAVWEIASQVEVADDNRYNAILQIATMALRPGMPMFGSLSHLEGDELVFDATAWTKRDPDAHDFSQGVFPSARVPFEHAMQSLFVSGDNQTRVWNDLGDVAGLGMMCEGMSVKSFIGTPVLIGRQTYYLTFASSQTTGSDPFAEDDIAFVDVVAAFYAHRFTQQKQFERIQFQIEHDALTGLENRVQFRKAVRDAIAAGTAFTVAFINLDGFRHINEREGNQIGDEVLVEVASTLKSVAEGDLVARMSADEFAVLVRGTPLDRYAAIFDEPFHTGDRDGAHMLGIGASIGASRFPFDGNTAEALMRRADVALDVAKARGGSTTLVFDGQMEAIIAESHLRVVELQEAIALDQLALVYQPTFELATRRITGAEALVRWDHPVRGRLPPSEFITFAENNGMIAALTRWVFRRTVRDVSGIDVLPPRFRVYFNLAPQMLEDIPFIAELRAALDVDPRLIDHIGIEVTETAAMQNVERSMNTIDLFRSWGLTVAIDDFGTGYSSLSYLKQLTVDVIKIDRSFVMGLPDDDRDSAITDMLLRITDQFGFATLAEGIETEEQARWLQEHGCRYGQGYLIAKPFEFSDLLERLEAQYLAA
jgi:diguanylate cyclase (GGDEF)-like protein